MSESLPAVRGEAQGMQLSPAAYDQLKEQARHIVRSKLAPKAVDSPEKVLVIAMKGAEIGIPPMQALSHIHIIEGRPTMSAELMAALVHRAGHKLRVTDTTAETCTVEGERINDPGHPSRLTWTMEDAKRAGVSGKGPWRSYPAAMLRARAISALCRYLFADVLAGVSYVPEEMGAEVGEEGEVLEASVEAEFDAPPEDADEEHEERVMDEIRAMLRRLPESVRPNQDDALAIAQDSPERAAKVLRRLQVLWERSEADWMPGEDFTDDEVGAIEAAVMGEKPGGGS